MDSVQDNVLIHTKLDCDIHKMPNFELCFEMTECHICTASPYCGWCPMTKKCLPGNLTTSTCSYMCPHGWNFKRDKCFDNKFSAGSMTNICKADMLMPVELATEKVRLNTVLELPTITHTPVVLGSVQRMKSIETIDHGHSTTQNIVEEKPILGQILRKMNVLYHHQQVVDLNTGHRLDVKDPKILHGIDID